MEKEIQEIKVEIEEVKKLLARLNESINILSVQTNYSFSVPSTQACSEEELLRQLKIINNK